MEEIKGEEREVAGNVYPRGYWAYSRPVSRVSRLLSTSLEQDKTSERDRVSKDLHDGDAGSECKDRSRNEELKRRNKTLSIWSPASPTHDILQDSSKSQDQSRSDSDKENGSNLFTSRIQNQLTRSLRLVSDYSRSKQRRYQRW
jgi:hypothetical protein